MISRPADGNTAFVADDSSGLKIIDVVDPAADGRFDRDRTL